MDQPQSTLYRNLAASTIRNLIKRRFDAQYYDTKEEAVLKILELIPEGVSVGAGESVTLHQIGIFTALKQRAKNEIVYPFFRDENGNILSGREETEQLMRKTLSTDIFISGTNALTLDGKIVNIDGAGNRVAPMIFGPQKVIIVVGANKIVKNVDEALNRIKSICAPMNALRHGIEHHDTEFLDLPCAKAGYCADCNRPQRMCNYTTIIEGQSHWHEGRFNIVIIGETLGF
jgi:hypothetical protein